MPVTKKQLLRIRVIDRVLRNKFRTAPATKEFLRDQCVEELFGIDSARSGNEVSLFTIDKDLRLMRDEYDAPIAYDRGSKEYYYQDGNYSLDGLGIGSREIVALESAAQLLSGFADNPLLRQFAPAITRLCERLSLQKKHDQEEDHFIEFEVLPQYDGWSYIDQIYNAIKECLVIEFDYFYFDDERTRTVRLHPYLLKESQQRWYIVGWSPEREALRLYGLERIRSLRMGPVRYPSSERKKIDAAAYFKHAYGIFTIPDKAPSRVEVRLDRRDLLYARTKPWHSSQEILSEDDHGGVLSWTVHVTPDFKMQLLSLGDKIEVLEPKWLRKEIAETLRSAADRYS
ncbi:MAG: WYL domain-containing protein [Flavobacteriales bacterium]|nr:WYL domain-containing protein [Flavobacteriales bacterium]